jgi:hypothetical protein
VFTKYDLFFDSLKRALHSPDHNSDALHEAAKIHAQERLMEECIEPFEEFVKRKVPHITVSSSSCSDF